MNNWMIDQSGWLTPVLVVIAIGIGVAIGVGLWLGRRVRAREFPPIAPASSPSTPSPPPFERECQILEVPDATGNASVKILACTLARTCMESYSSMCGAASVICAKAAETGVFRVMIELAPFGPASRGSFWTLRSLSKDFSHPTRGGLLVVRFHPPLPGGPTWFSSRARDFYEAIPATTQEADAKYVAGLEPWQTPELDEL